MRGIIRLPPPFGLRVNSTPAATASCRYQANTPPRRAGDKGPHQGGPETKAPTKEGRRQGGKCRGVPPLVNPPPLVRFFFRGRPRARGLLRRRGPGRGGGWGLSASIAPALPRPPDVGGDESDQDHEADGPPCGVHLQAEPEHGAEGQVEDDGSEDVERDASEAGRATAPWGVGVHEARIEGSERRRRWKPPGPHRFARKRSGDGAAKWRSASPAMRPTRGRGR